MKTLFSLIVSILITVSYNGCSDSSAQKPGSAQPANPALDKKITDLTPGDLISLKMGYPSLFGCCCCCGGGHGSGGGGSMGGGYGQFGTRPTTTVTAPGVTSGSGSTQQIFSIMVSPDNGSSPTLASNSVMVYAFSTLPGVSVSIGTSTPIAVDPYSYYYPMGFSQIVMSVGNPSSGGLTSRRIEQGLAPAGSTFGTGLGTITLPVSVTLPAGYTYMNATQTMYAPTPPGGFYSVMIGISGNNYLTIVVGDHSYFY